MVDVVGLRFITEGEKEAIAALSLYRAGIRQLRDLQDTQVAAMNRAMREQERATRDAIGAQRDAATAFSRLQASMDPAIAATQRYAAAQKTVREALAQGVISAQQAAAALKQLEQAYDAARLQRYAEAQRKISSEIINGNAAVNRINAAYQTLSERVRAGTLTAQQHAAAQKALARELAATNNYLTKSGALNTQKALAELRAAQATRDATAADVAAAAAKTRLTQSYQQLLASVNPVIARQQQTKQVVDMLRAAVNAQAITVQQAAQALLQYRASLNSLNGGLNQASLGLNRTGVIIQQAGYQFGDFAVQVQSGTNVMVALGQQATQLIGTFAAFATSVRSVAILSALGVVVPILTAIGAYMMRTSGSAKTLEQRVNDLTSAGDKLKSTLEIISSDDTDLAAKFGDLTPIVRRLTEAMRELNRASEMKSLVATVEGFRKAVAPSFWAPLADTGSWRAAFSGMSAGGGGTSADARRKLEEKAFSTRTGYQMGLTEYEAFIKGMKDAAERGDVPEVGRLFEGFLADATDSGTAIAKITSEGALLADQMLRANLFVAETTAQYNGTADAAKRVLNFEQERARLQKQGRDTEQETKLAQAAAKFGEDSLRYRQEERAVARQNYDAQLSEQLQLKKLSTDQMADLMASYDANMALVDAADQQEDAQLRINAAYAQYNASRREGATAEGAGTALLTQLQERLRLQNEINLSGEDSTAVLALQRAQHEAIVREQVNQRGLAATLAEEIVKAEMALFDAENAARGLASVDINKGVAAAASSAAQLAKNLNVSLQQASRILALGGGRGPEPVVFDPRDPRYDPVRAEMERLRLDPNRTRTQASLMDTGGVGSGAGTGAGASQFVSMFPELQAAYTRAAELASQYKQEVEILDSALARGMITQQQYNTFLESAQAAYEQSAMASEELMRRQDELAQRLGNTLGNLFMAATNGADAFRSALSNVLSSLASMLANAAFTQLLKSSGGGLLGAVSKFVGAVLPSANGNVFMGGNVVPFANGGVVSGPTMFPMRNGTGLMGEAGPEAIMPLRRGRDGRLGVAAAQTQAAPVDVRVFVDQDGNWQAKVERIADRRVRQQAPTLVRQSVQAVYATNEERKLR